LGFFWNPLDYYLPIALPHQEVAEKYPPLPKVNVGNGVGSYYLDLLIEEKRKNEGRKK
jgi:hypothetical protein